MLRRLAPDQPDHFAFSPDNEKWARAQIAKYPQNRAQSAIIPLLWRAQEQEGWLTRPAIEAIADLLQMPYIRALEVASFYFMFQLAPIGKLAHIQICGTTSCMLCGSEALIETCQEKIAPNPHQISEDGNFSWEEVECLGACTNAPLAQIGKDYFEDLTPEKLEAIIDCIAAGGLPVPGPQNGRFSSEPVGAPTSLKAAPKKGAKNPAPREAHNASQELALEHGDSIARITSDKPKAESARIIDLRDKSTG